MKNLSFFISVGVAILSILLTQLTTCNIKEQPFDVSSYQKQIASLSNVIDSLTVLPSDTTVIYVEVPKTNTKYITQVRTQYIIRDTIIRDTTQVPVLIEVINPTPDPIVVETGDDWYNLQLTQGVDTTTVFISVRDSINVGLSVHKRFLKRRWQVDVQSHNPYIDIINQQTFVFDRKTIKRFR